MIVQDPVSEKATMEAAWGAQEERVDGCLKLAQKYTSAVRAWKKACQTGHLSARQKAAQQVSTLLPQMEEAVREASGAWNLDATSWLESGAWLSELQATANDAGLRTQVEGDAFISSPVVVRSLPGRSALRVGRALWPHLRPRAVVDELKRLRDQKGTAGSQEFLEGLYGVWQRIRSDDAPVARFREIYAWFALTPGWKKENPEVAFGQAIYALHRSDVRTTRRGATFQVEYASGSVKEKDVFTVWAEDGSPLRYYGIRFREPQA